MKAHIIIEKTDIPPVLEEDILKTIQQSKKIVQQLGVKKHSSIIDSLKMTLFYYGWKGIVFQTLLGLSLLLFGWFIVPMQSKYYSMSLILTGGVILSICMFFEFIRSDIYSMSELENTCPYSVQRLLLWKILILGGISLLGILLFSIYLSMQSDLKFLTLLSGGCIPFFLLTGMTLHFQIKGYLFQSFMSLYVVVLSLIMVLELNFLPIVLNILDTFGGMFTLLSFSYCMLFIYKQVRRTYDHSI